MRYSVTFEESGLIKWTVYRRQFVCSSSFLCKI